MTNMVITISREYGSGGRQIGEQLAKELGFAFYEHEPPGRCNNLRSAGDFCWNRRCGGLRRPFPPCL